MAISGLECIQRIRERGDTTLLAFSCGKDAIAAWLALRPHFPRIVPYYLYLVPGLEFVEKSLKSYEEFFETPIIRLPHPTLFRWLNACIFQPPERQVVIEQAGLQEFEYADVRQWIYEDHNLSPNVMVADGVRAADSPMRRISIMRNGPISENLHKYHPIWDWKKADVVSAFHKSGVHLPIDYRWFGRTFDGLDYRFLEPLRRQAPDDYERILHWFPLADLELFRRDCARAYQG